MDDAWVVMACRIGNSQHFWAWCRPSREHPGFEDIFYTERDGLTAMSPAGDTLPTLGEHLFTVVFPPEVASTGERFPVAEPLSVPATWRPETPTLEPTAADAGSPD